MVPCANNTICKMFIPRFLFLVNYYIMFNSLKDFNNFSFNQDYFKLLTLFLEMSRIVIILGAGVIGLTTAVILQENGFHIKIIAKNFPSDPVHDSKTYTSPL